MLNLYSAFVIYIHNNLKVNNMSTRCNIAVVVKESDRKRSLNLIDYAEEAGFDLNRICTGDKLVFWKKIYNKAITMNDKAVLQIYCHHDGYPDGVGAELIKHFNTYEEALALVLAGDTSYLEDGNTGAYAVDEGYEDTLPEALDEPLKHNDYLYTWKDGEWKIGVSTTSLKETLEY